MSRGLGPEWTSLRAQAKQSRGAERRRKHGLLRRSAPRNDVSSRDGSGLAESHQAWRTIPLTIPDFQNIAILAMRKDFARRIGEHDRRVSLLARSRATRSSPPPRAPGGRRSRCCACPARDATRLLPRWRRASSSPTASRRSPVCATPRAARRSTARWSCALSRRAASPAKTWPSCRSPAGGP